MQMKNGTFWAMSPTPVHNSMTNVIAKLPGEASAPVLPYPQKTSRPRIPGGRPSLNKPKIS